MIDEISLVSGDLAGRSLLVIADYLQLPPV